MTPRLGLVSGVLALCLAASSADAQEVSPPSAPDSVQFLAIGDTGTGDSAQYQVAEQVAKAHAVFPFTFAIMMGDNLYGSERPQDYQKKFEIPYKTLLDAKVEFYASLGNHDDPNQRLYKPFNMNGERFYTFKKGNVRFFALDSNYFDRAQADWLEKALADSTEDWKICFFHHPLYSSGARHGSEVDLRAQLEPLFLKYGVQVVFAGHEHFYERMKPQKGIYYFVNGGGAKLRDGDITKTTMTAVGYDTDRSYMVVEIAGDVLTFQTLSRTGKRVDSGSIRRSVAAESTAGAQSRD
jgi:3',5'-cyclic AMP phosphodiesterase CpdA